jgi:hypothetical protein
MPTVIAGAKTGNQSHLTPFWLHFQKGVISLFFIVFWIFGGLPDRR